MNRLMQSAAIVPLLAAGAAAQDTPADVVKKQMAEIDGHTVRFYTAGAVKGPVVKGMPYSADEITETNQVLADGTRIHREIKATVYRDSEGRTRRETPENIMINDPVAGATYVIDPKTNAVKTLKMSSAAFVRRESGTATAAAGAVGKGTFEMRVSGDGPPDIAIDGKPLEPRQVEKMIAEAKASGRAEPSNDMVFFSADGGGRGLVTSAPVMRKLAAANSEQLGKKNVEGVIADGTRSVQTIATGDIGNDRPIQIVNENWYSEEIGMMVMTKRTDPRNGEETYRLTNIHRGDPPAYLFQAPADRKM